MQATIKPVSKFCPQTLAVCLKFRTLGTVIIYKYANGEVVCLESHSVISHVSSEQGEVVASFTSKQAKDMPTEELTEAITKAYSSTQK